MLPFVYSPPVDPWLRVLHVDRDMCVIDKPSGLLSVPGREHKDSAYARVLEKHPGAFVVHRLDMDTSGVIVFALRRKAERALKAQFRERTVSKLYLARVWGRVKPDSGEIDLPLVHDAANPPLSRVCHDTGKPALTRFEVISRGPGSTLLRLRPVTGRSHQLRVHMLALGHPILGDRFYAHDDALAAAPRLMLHAARLDLDHPYRGERMSFEAAAPEGLTSRTLTVRPPLVSRF